MTRKSKNKVVKESAWLVKKRQLIFERTPIELQTENVRSKFCRERTRYQR
jgi:hypothetical protein